MSSAGDQPESAPREWSGDRPPGDRPPGAHIPLGKDRPPGSGAPPEPGSPLEPGAPPVPAGPPQPPQGAQQPYAPAGWRPYAPDPHYPAPPAYPPDQTYPQPSNVPARLSAVSQLGLILAVLGLGVSAAGLFALPLASYPRTLGGTYFGQVRDFVRLANDRALDRFYSGLAQIWWNWGLLLVGAVLVVLVALAAITPTRRLVGVLIAVIAVAAAVVQAVALANSPDLRQVSVTLRSGASMYKYAGSGLWVAFIGFGVLALGGVLLAVSPARR
jgi:hypothetical protein